MFKHWNLKSIDDFILCYNFMTGQRFCIFTTVSNCVAGFIAFFIYCWLLLHAIYNASNKIMDTFVTTSCSSFAVFTIFYNCCWLLLYAIYDASNKTMDIFFISVAPVLLFLRYFLNVTGYCYTLSMTPAIE